MDAGASLIADVEPAEAMQPGQGAFDDPPRLPETAAVRCPALRQLGPNPAAVQLVAMGLGIVAAVPLDTVGFPAGPPGPAAQNRERIDQRQQFGDVIAVGGGQPRDNRNPLRVGENVMFRPLLAAIGGVRSSFFPPRSARTELLSTMVRARSSWPRRRNSVSKTSCSRRQTPARCHCTSRRQQVLPDPHPISFGSICHGTPARNTKRMPVRAARSATRGRPIDGQRTRRRFGNNGSICAHKASSRRGADMRDRLTVGHATVPIRTKQYKRPVNYF